MKRFSKILFLMLALVALLTAFSIVALAADEAERATPVTYSGTNNAAEMDFNFQKDVATGAVKSYTSTKRGVFYIDATLDGNKYLNAEYVYNDSEDTRTGNTYEIHSTYTRTDAPSASTP